MSISEAPGSPEAMGRSICIRLLACAADSAPADVLTVAKHLSRDDLLLLDRPCADVYDLAVRIALRGEQPSGTALHAEATRHGAYGGRAGHLRRQVVLDLIEATAWGPQLSSAAADALSLAFRATWRSIGATADEAADQLGEVELAETARRSLERVLGLCNRMQALRGAVVA